MASITGILHALRSLHPDLERQCLHGSCFRLYLLLAEVFPEAEPWYDSNHVITKIGERFYDIRGEVAPDKHYPMRNEPAIFNGAHEWHVPEE